MKATLPLLRAGVLALLAGATLPAACEHAYYSQPRPGNARALIRVDFSTAATQGGLREALARANQLHLHLAPQADSGAAVDTLVALPGGNDSVDVAFVLGKASVSYAITADLLLSGQPLFHGSGYVTLRSGQTAPATIDLVPVPARLSLPPSFGPVTSIGDTLRLTGAALFASADTVTGATLTWTSLDPALLSVTSDGTAVALSEGNAPVRAQYQGLTADSKVVIAPAVAAIAVSPPSLQLVVGASAALSAVATDARGHVLVRSFRWASSNPAVAQVDSSGQVTAVAAGSASITASAGGATSQPVALQALQVPIASVAIQPTSAQVAVGQTVQLQATALDSAGKPLSGRLFTWSSSDPTIATVDSSGLVSGVKVGTVAVRAAAQQDPTKSASAPITVTPPPSIALSRTSVALRAIVAAPSPAGDSLAVTNSGGGLLSGLSASVAYAAGQPTGWLSASLGASTAPTTLTLQLSTSSLPVGIYDATVTIASSLPGVAAVSVGVQLSVEIVPVAAVVMTPPAVSLVVGQQATLTATPEDALGNTLAGRPVAWVIRDASVATLSATSGNQVSVTGVGAGSTWAVATSSGVSDSAHVSVCVPVITPAATGAGFTTPVGQNPQPDTQTIALSNGGCGGPLTGLSASVTYAATSASGWLQAQVTPSSLSLVVASSTLPAGVDSATVTITSTQPGVAPATVQVTITVLGPLLISNLRTVAVSVNDPACVVPGASFSGGSLYTYAYDYSSFANGSGAGSETINWTFNPSGTAGSFSYGLASPSPQSGTNSYTACWRYNNDSSVTSTLTVTDGAGRVSNTLSITDQRPAGANSAPGGVTASSAPTGVAGSGGPGPVPPRKP